MYTSTTAISKTTATTSVKYASDSKVGKLVAYWKAKYPNNLSKLDQAEIIKKIYNEVEKQNIVAKLLGLSVSKVSNTMTLSELPKSMKDRIKTNQLSVTLVLETLRLNKGTGLTIPQILEKIEELAQSGDKITKTTIDASDKRYNSIKAFKHLTKTIDRSKITDPQMMMAFDFTSQVLAGTISPDKMKKIDWTRKPEWVKFEEKSTKKLAKA